MARTKNRIDEFNFPKGYNLSGKYEIVSKLGGGWEGEVYLVKEKLTGIDRAAKFFLPHRNPDNKAVKFYAQKLHKLRHCPILIQYLTQETLPIMGHEVTYLISDYVDGVPLSSFLKEQPGKRLPPFQALHLLHALAKGLQDVHLAKDYHGDLHTDNVIVSRFGLGFDLKLIDMFHWGKASPENIRNDVVDLVRIFYDALGGQKYYRNQPWAVKDIVCGLKKNLILKKFRTAGQLRAYIENMTWD